MKIFIYCLYIGMLLTKSQISLANDVNYDKKVGIDDAVTALQVASGIKSQIYLPTNLNWKNEWDKNKIDYCINDVVAFNGSSYICILAHKSNEKCLPTNEALWEVLALKGEDGLQGIKGVKGDAGPQGLQGEKGEKGDIGPQGLQGEKGEKGDKGDKGEKGDIGPQGLQGEKGEKGDIGPQGLQGEKGEKGDIGPQGLQGEKGEKGDIGPQGLQGEKGEKGDKGDKGDKGEKGDIGPQGLQGEKGEKGDVGPQGICCETNFSANIIILELKFLKNHSGTLQDIDISDAGIPEGVKALYLEIYIMYQLPGGNLSLNIGRGLEFGMVVSSSGSVRDALSGFVPHDKNSYQNMYRYVWVPMPSDNIIKYITYGYESSDPEWEEIRKASITIKGWIK